MPGTKAYRSAWQETIKAAEAYNDPGRFTAFIGYEWTRTRAATTCTATSSSAATARRRSLVEPYTTLKPLGSDNPEDLWKWMAATEEKTGSEVLAIAHNGNLSNGTMFPIIEAFGKKIDKNYVETRARWERLYEVTQMKGDGETHPFLSPNDEFANFERWDKANLAVTQAKTKDMLEFEYARSALKNGLALEAKLGTNPYKFGLIGSTDAHTGLAAVEEENFFGKTTASEPSPERLHGKFMENPKIGVKIMDWEVVLVRLRCRVGDREHARGDLRRDAAPRDLRHHGPAHARALLRRLGFRAEGRTQPRCRRPSATPKACRWAAT